MIRRAFALFSRDVARIAKAVQAVFASDRFDGLADRGVDLSLFGSSIRDLHHVGSLDAMGTVAHPGDRCSRSCRADGKLCLDLRTMGRAGGA